LRKKRECPVTIPIGTNYPHGEPIQTEYLRPVLRLLMEKYKKGEIPPLWDGKAGQRIVEILANKVVMSYR